MSSSLRILAGIVIAFVLLGGYWLVAEEDHAALPSDVTGIESPHAAPAAVRDASTDPERVVPLRTRAYEPETLKAESDEIVGTVTDGDGAAIADAKITAVTVAQLVYSNFGTGTFSTTTDSEGHYRLKVMESEQYSVVAETDVHQAALRKPVASGSVADFELLAGAALRVRVVDAVDSTPVGKVIVRVARGEALPVATATTLPDGTAGFRNLSPGEQKCTISAPAHADPEPIVVAVNADAASDLNVQLLRGKDVRGRVLAEATQNPIAGARIIGEGKRAISDEHGDYVLRGLPARQITLTAFADGWCSNHDNANLAGSRVSAVRNFRLQASGVISGIIQNDQGQPQSGVTVAPVQVWDDGDYVYDYGDGAERSCITGPDGRFSVSGMQPGRRQRFAVRATRPGLPITISQTVALTPELPRAEITVVVREQRATAEGLVVDEAGTPVAGARITASMQPRGAQDESAHQRRSLRAGSDGRFTVPALPDGWLSIEANSEDCLTGRAQCAVRNGAVAETLLRIVLKRGLPVRCRVANAQGEPVDRALVTVRGQGRSMTAYTAADGQCSLAVTGPPPWRVSCTAKGYERFESGALTPDGDEGIRLTLQPETLLRMTVRERNQQGTPRGVSLRAWMQTPQSSTKNGSGRVSMTRVQNDIFEARLAPGSWRLLVEVPGLHSVEKLVDLAAGTVTDIGVIELDRGVTLDGTVSVQDKGPAARARVFLRCLDAVPQEKHLRLAAECDSDGWFHADTLRPGLYEMVVESESAPLLIQTSMRIDAEVGRNLALNLTPETELALQCLKDPASGADRELAADHINEIYSRIEINSEELGISSLRNWHGPSSTTQFVVSAEDGRALSIVDGPRDPVLGRLWTLSPTLTIHARGAQSSSKTLRLPRGRYSVDVRAKDRSVQSRSVELEDRTPRDVQFDIRTGAKSGG